MSALTKKEILEVVSDGFRYFIYDGTQDVLLFVESKLEKKDSLILEKLDRVMKRIRICTDVAFSFDDEMKGKLTKDAAWWLSELRRFRKALNKKAPELEGSKFLCELDEHIEKIKSCKHLESDYVITLDDVNAQKIEFEKEKEEKETQGKDLAEKIDQEILEYKEKFEEWRSKNMNENFDFSILDELQLDIIKEGLKTELKCISISWIQRNYQMGYAKAGAIVDFFEKNKIVSTYEQSKKLAGGKYGRVILVDIEG